jgi:hypothetical protein
MCACNGARRVGRRLTTSGDLALAVEPTSQPLESLDGQVPDGAKYMLVARPDGPLYFQTYQGAVEYQQGPQGGGLLRRP